MGSNAYGKLGITLKNQMQVEYYNTPKLVDRLISTPISKVSCGWNHTSAITRDGVCYTWG